MPERTVEILPPHGRGPRSSRGRTLVRGSRSRVRPPRAPRPIDEAAPPTAMDVLVAALAEIAIGKSEN